MVRGTVAKLASMSSVESIAEVAVHRALWTFPFGRNPLNVIVPSDHRMHGQSGKPPSESNPVPQSRWPGPEQ